MIKLINGRGQLGDVLKQKINLYDIDDYNVYIYHTWKLDTKSYDEQNLEFEKFKEFVDEHFKDKIIFISTFSEKDDWYVHFKQLSESYLLNHCKNALVIKLPTFIGNHCNMFSIEKLKKDKVKPYGVMELISIDKAVDEIYRLCSYKGKLKIIKISGEKVSAKLLYEIYKKMGVLNG
jgi:hypothetical protein